MYSFTIRDNGGGLEILITRSMLALAAIATLVYRSSGYFFVNIIFFFLLVCTAVFIKFLLVKLRLNNLVILTAAATMLFAATHSISFAIILLVYGWAAKFLNKKPVIKIATNGVTLQTLFSSPTYPWNDFSNVILKDNLLTLDFKNNKLVQVNTDENQALADETVFNDYCKKFISQG